MAVPQLTFDWKAESKQEKYHYMYVCRHPECCDMAYMTVE